MASENSVRLAELLASGEAQRLLRELMLRLEEKERSDISDADASFGHTLTSRQIMRLNAHVERAKKKGSFGGYLRELALKRESYRKRLFSVACISPSHWSEVLTNKKHPSKDFLFRVAIALKLSPDDAFELVKRAGYILSDDIIKDAIINWCLREGIYDFYEINDILVERGFDPLVKYAESDRESNAGSERK